MNDQQLKLDSLTPLPLLQDIVVEHIEQTRRARPTAQREEVALRPRRGLEAPCLALEQLETLDGLVGDILDQACSAGNVVRELSTWLGNDCGRESYAHVQTFSDRRSCAAG